MDVDMKKIEQTIQTLRRWSEMPNFLQMPPTIKNISNMREAILMISTNINPTYPIISAELKVLREQLFYSNAIGVLYINPCVLGQIVEALIILYKEISDRKDDMWNLIHPSICKSSKKLFIDGNYINATVDAFIEINDRLKNIYKLLAPSEKDIPDGVDLMHKIFSGKPPLLQINDLTSESGRNIQDGTHFMMAGAISALRNPKSHSNKEQISKDEAVRRLMFASMLMYKIDEAVAFTQVEE